MAAVAGSEPTPARAEGREPGAQPATTWWVLGAIIVLGIVVRFTTLNEQSFWFDEATTWGIVDHGLGHVLSTVPRTESTPPTYYVLLWLWSRAFGTGEVGLRSFSALCSTLTIPVVWIIGRRLVSNRVGLIAALLTSVNALLFWYAQEARSYSLLLLLSAVALLAFVHALQSPTTERLALWGLASALALAAHYYAAVMVVPQAVYLGVVLRRRGRLASWTSLAGIAPVVAVGAALLPLLIHQNDGRAGYIATQGGSLAYRLGQLVKEDIIGSGQPLRALLTAIGCALVLAAGVLLVRRSERRERRAAGMLIAIGVGGVLVAVLVALAGSDYVNTRNLLPTWPALMLVVAIGLGTRRGRVAGSIATAGLVVLSLVCVRNIVADPLFQRPDWRGAAQAVGHPSGPRAIVSDVQSQVPLAPYMPRLATFPAGGARVRDVDVIWVQRAYQWGPLGAIAPVPLPGFTLTRVDRTRSYVVLHYAAATPQVESPASLDRLYPLAPRALALIQAG